MNEKIREEKRRLRSQVKQLEQGLEEAYLAACGAAVNRQLLALPEYRTARTVFCFASFGRELPTWAFLQEVLKSGRRLCLPRCAKGGELELCVVRALGELAPGAYGILEPRKDAPRLLPEDVDLAVVPCCACTASGERLGRGGGYYDRFLAQYRGAAVMLTMERLLLDALPTEPHDAVIPLVLTERGLYRRGKMTSLAEG